MTSSTPAPLLVANELEIHFGGVRAVDGVSLKVRPSSVTAVIGPNGAGKTTLFNLLTGVLEPSAGSLTFDGKDITGAPIHKISRLGVARTFQNLEMFDESTVLDTVLVGRHRHLGNGSLTSALRLRSAIRQESANRAKALEILERFELTEDADRIATGLPYGRQRAVELARALALEPRLLLLDEPMAGLTGAESRQAAARIRKLADEGIAVLVVEHHIEAILAISDHVVVLDRGQVISEGPPAAVRNDPAVIEAYLGAPDD